MKLTFPFLVLSLSVITAGAQITHGGLEFSQTEFNYPEQEHWVSKVDSILITNISSRKIHLLKQHYPREFQLRFPEKAIEPGATEILEVIFTPRETGKFDQKFELFHSGSMKSLPIRYHGEVISFDEFSTQACPSFEKQNLRPLQFNFEVLVKDSATHKSIPGAEVEFMRSELFWKEKTDASGRVMIRSQIDYYDILAFKDNYTSASFSGHVNPKTRKIELLLAKVDAGKDEEKAEALKPDTTAPVDLNTYTPAEVNKTFPLEEYKKNNIVFLIDKSMSMRGPDRMPYLKTSMHALVEMLRKEDRVSIIAYASQARIWVDGISGLQKDSLNAIIERLQCGGRTEGGRALQLAYKHGKQHFIKDGINQIVIATDGGFNGLAEKEDQLKEMVAAYAAEDIYLSVLTFGENRYGKYVIRQLSEIGKGFHQFISSPEDASTLLNDHIRVRSRR